MICKKKLCYNLSKINFKYITFPKLNYCNMKKIIGISLLVSLFFISCKKDTPAVVCTLNSTSLLGSYKTTDGSGGNSGYILTIDSTTGLTINTEYGSGGAITKIIYNPDRKSIWAIRPTDGLVIEVQVQLSSFFNVETISATGVNENYYGSLSI